MRTEWDKCHVRGTYIVHGDYILAFMESLRETPLCFPGPLALATESRVVRLRLDVGDILPGNINTPPYCTGGEIFFFLNLFNRPRS